MGGGVRKKGRSKEKGDGEGKEGSVGEKEEERGEKKKGLVGEGGRCRERKREEVR